MWCNLPTLLVWFIILNIFRMWPITGKNSNIYFLATKYICFWLVPMQSHLFSTLIRRWQIQPHSDSLASWLCLVSFSDMPDKGAYPAEIKRCSNAGLLLVHRLRRWSNSKAALGQRIVSDVADSSKSGGIAGRRTSSMANQIRWLQSRFGRAVIPKFWPRGWSLIQ